MRSPAWMLAAALIFPGTPGAAALAAEITESRSGVAFAARVDDLVLTGVGLRTRTMLKVKVYAIGLYVSEPALAGLVSAHKSTASPAFYRDLVQGDFGKQIVLKFVRDVSAEQIREAFRERLGAADPEKRDLFFGYFGPIRAGQEIALRWKPGGTLETTVAGLAKPVIVDKAFAATIFGIWLGEKPLQEDIKKDLVARAVAGG